MGGGRHRRGGAACRAGRAAHGQEGQEALAAALVEHVAAQLAAYKKPRAVRFVADIPKTAVGKLNRRAVRERLRDSGA